MADKEFYARLTRVLRDVFDDEEIVATPELTADDVDEWDSLSNIRLFLAIETEFGIRFSTAEIASLANVGELVTVINKKISAA